MCTAGLSGLLRLTKAKTGHIVPERHGPVDVVEAAHAVVKPAPGTAQCDWGNGNHQVFRLRNGPRYQRGRLKDVPGQPLYRCVGLEVVQTAQQVKSYLGHDGVLERMQFFSSPGDSETGGKGGPLPRTIVVNFQIPFEVGPLRGSHPAEDHGCSVVLTFLLEPWAATQAADLSNACPAVRLLAKYLQYEGPPKREGNLVSGCFKAVGFLENVDALEMPAALRQVVNKFNGKPVLIEKETRRFGGVPGQQVVELATDVRGFNFLARFMLQKLRGQLPRASIQVGLLIQGCTDDELPEEFLGIVRFSGLNLMPDCAAKDTGGISLKNDTSRLRCGETSSSVISELRRLLRSTVGLACASRKVAATLPLHADFDEDTPWATPRSRACTDELPL